MWHAQQRRIDGDVTAAITDDDITETAWEQREEIVARRRQHAAMSRKYDVAVVAADDDVTKMAAVSPLSVDAAQQLHGPVLAAPLF